jgi:hypothetical protein
MLSRECDRCGQTTNNVDHPEWGQITIAKNGVGTVKEIDACPECIRAGREFVRRLPVSGPA